MSWTRRQFGATSLAALTASGQASYPEAVISNRAITMRIPLPDPERGYYRGTRFDWSGQISSLKTLGHEYFGKWFAEYDPKLHDAIMGPVEEFTTRGSALGYDEAKVGETFVRIGVGALRKPDEPRFERFKTYDIVDVGKWEFEKSPGEARFRQTLSPQNGYAYQYTKSLKLIADRAEMHIVHVLRNTGSKKIETTQYNHNFFVIDGHPVGPDTARVEFAFPLRAKSPVRGDAAKVEGSRIRYVKELGTKETFSGSFEGADIYDIRVESPRAATGVRIRGDRPISQVVYWSMRNTFCPEPYIDLAVEPGAEVRWTYQYEFYSL